MSANVAEADSADLEALFDSIVQEKSENARAVAPKAEAQAQVPAQAQAHDNPPESVINRVGHLTRTLHDALRELGYDRLLEKSAAMIPDARDRLNYVVKMTEQAAVRALNAIEAAQPIQARLGDEAGRLSALWQKLFDKKLSVEEFKQLVSATRDYLADVPEQTRATNAQLLEIMMAQDFQDLTGQVIKRITEMVQGMESQLLKLLVENAPAERRVAAESRGLLNGPVTGADRHGDVVTSQSQVDELLESLGF